MFMVAYMTQRTGKAGQEITRDHYEMADSLAEARAIYSRVLTTPHLHSATIAAVVESTDYSPATLGDLSAENC